MKLKTKLWGLTAVLGMALVGCGTSRQASGLLGLEDYRLVDLTYPFDETTVYWPTSRPFEHERVAWGRTPQGYWYSSFNFCTSEHGGTHLDAPIHFAESGLSVEKLPLERLFAEAVVIDVALRCEHNPDYTVTAEDIRAFEQAHGKIPNGAIVLVRTGWGRYWPDKGMYLGTDRPGDVENLRFPGIGPDAARLLVERGVAAVGIDTASTDPGYSRTFETHQILAEANIAGLENVANLQMMPEKGGYVVALPMKIASGSGAPCRIIGLVPKTVSNK